MRQGEAGRKHFRPQPLANVLVHFTMDQILTPYLPFCRPKLLFWNAVFQYLSSIIIVISIVIINIILIIKYYEIYY